LMKKEMVNNQVSTTLVVLISHKLDLFIHF
jgi:hypothetical protein